ncbi:MAG: beta-ketoacyl-ACP synthase II [Acidobacteria bacterium]|nr:MAG: beta-ketoacyl-ACP synthase II [Acidobacteriota bacterium]MCL4286584.1 beta-ketoacyl-ACP synthase II [Thermoleophilia bacterium]GIK77488.1 MAG: 3-oxoacyl-[acyl-carrier-protein] synthase 2 [Actinomycetes bacterium]
MSRRVAITGVGAVTPLGVGADALIDRWCAGDVGIVDGVAACAGFDPADHLSVKERRRADRFTQLALVAAREAITDAGWDPGLPCAGERVGCIIGTGVGGIGTIEDQHDVLRDRGPGSLSPLAVPLMMANAASGVVAMRHGLKGECYGTVSACAAGAHAIGAGLRLVRHGVVDACLVGGAEAAITPLAGASFVGMGATSASGVSRPFDRRRDGFVLGEGAGALALEPEGPARRRGARILGWLDGYAATADAHHLTAPEPAGDGSARAIAAAIADAGWMPAEIDYVNAHGTSTPLNDRSETIALKRALGDAAAAAPVSSAKSAIGHLLGAAGAVEAVATVLAFERGVIPPTLGYEEPDPELDLDYVPRVPRRLARNGRAPRAISNSFGFGGHNAVICIEGAGR